MSDSRRRYAAYLLRLWEVEERESVLWRASLESPKTGERRGFAHLTELFTYLEDEICHVVQGRPTHGADGRGGDFDE